MPKVTFVQPDGRETTIDAPVGQSIMETATRDMVNGIIGECGGCCSCATCHVYVDEGWFGKLDPMDQMEESMLEGAVEPGPRSRLSCQIKMSDELDGIVVRIPAGQA
jgi:2Fe-2S ferredoxin